MCFDVNVNETVWFALREREREYTQVLFTLNKLETRIPSTLKLNKKTDLGIQNVDKLLLEYDYNFIEHSRNLNRFLDWIHFPCSQLEYRVWVIIVETCGRPLVHGFTSISLTFIRFKAEFTSARVPLRFFFFVPVIDRWCFPASNTHIYANYALWCGMRTRYRIIDEPWHRTYYPLKLSIPQNCWCF